MSRPMGQILWVLTGFRIGLGAGLLSNTHKLANDVVSTQHVYKSSKVFEANSQLLLHMRLRLSRV